MRKAQVVKFKKYSDAVSGEHQIMSNSEIVYNDLKTDKQYTTQVLRILIEPELSISELVDGKVVEVKDSGHVNLLIAQAGTFKHIVHQKKIFKLSKHSEFEMMIDTYFEYNHNKELLIKELNELKERNAEIIFVLGSNELYNLEKASIGSIESEPTSEGRDRTRRPGRDRTRRPGSVEGRAASTSKDRPRSRSRDRTRGSRSIGGKTKKNKRRTITRKNR
jgi:hypothetical protein